MNIKQAKAEIIHTIQAYLQKDEDGFYKIPAIRQRPVLLMGPPGVGKTQIMEQAARECKIGLVSYTITHHTRQSAVGLPMIKEEEYQGKKYSVTEYTMSEIIASIYKTMEETGLKEGILFIDEINCVSETLAPTMLQFLQCKTFGNEKVPEGWIIVAAGNPPEFNKSVREFDMVTMDRLRYIPIEADWNVWKEYAEEVRIHPAIISYLSLRPKNFYRIEQDIDGMQFVTARGWEDLSNFMQVYETLGIEIKEEIIHEFLQHEEAAKDFHAYLDLYRKYEDHYGIGDILDGKTDAKLYRRLEHAPFDERLSVVYLLLSGLSSLFYEVFVEKQLTDAWYDFLKEYQELLRNLEAFDKKQGIEAYKNLYEKKEKEVELAKKEKFYTREGEKLQKRLLAKLAEGIVALSKMEEGDVSKKECFLCVKTGFDGQTEYLYNQEDKVRNALEYAFDFMENAFENGQELVIFVTELATGKYSALFLARHTCDRYLQYSRTLLMDEQKEQLLSELAMNEIHQAEHMRNL